MKWNRVLAFAYFTQGVTNKATGQTIPGWLTLHPEDDNKFTYALKRVMERVLKLNKEMERKVEDLEIDWQATDANKVLLYNPDGTRAHTAEGEKGLRDAKEALMQSEIEIEPHWCAEIPDDLDEAAREILKGFVIRETELKEVKSAAG
jgi:hypothetical protein